MDCNICVEKYNNSNRIIIICDYCQFECCKDCVKKYLLSITEDSHCMNCKKKWDRKILSKKMDKTFMTKTYKSYREQILFEREKSLLPSTQPHVERIIKNEQIDDEILKKRQQILELKRDLQELFQEKNFQETSKVNDKKQFIRPCSNPNGCKGFLSTQWKCGLCNEFTCRNCLEIKLKDDEHKCDPVNVSTAQLILKETKNCPKCGVSIFKISGCSQIWCTNCHTAFSWDTGKIELGNIHNPHYFEWLHLRGGNPNGPNGPNGCGREIDNYFINDINRIMRMMRNLDNINSPGFSHGVKRLVNDYMQKIIHIREVVIQRFRVNEIEDNLNIRINYMRNKITEDEFKKKIQRKEKDNQKKREIYDVLRMFIDCSTEILYRYYNYISSNNKHNENILDEIKKLIEYVNQCFLDISETYNCHLWKLDSFLEFS